MPTLYQPQHTDGRTGPLCSFMSCACLWIFDLDESGWDVKPIDGNEIPLQQIQDGLTAGRIVL